jgi:hypothetical protein
VSDAKILGTECSPLDRSRARIPFAINPLREYVNLRRAVRLVQTQYNVSPANNEVSKELADSANCEMIAMP